MGLAALGCYVVRKFDRCAPAVEIIICEFAQLSKHDIPQVFAIPEPRERSKIRSSVRSSNAGRLDLFSSCFDRSVGAMGSDHWIAANTIGWTVGRLHEVRHLVSEPSTLNCSNDKT